ncbi:hypothetical protein FQR65_LT04094 [Abscondita terminalis]|nr:hypothetical protein FQR65_LT04094 [Abscondita terminalis]
MSANPNYKPSEGKREEFRKYLEKTGVMDALTKVLVCLYEEPDKPENAVEVTFFCLYLISLTRIRYICNKLAHQLCGETLTEIQNNLQDAVTKIAELESENSDLRAAAEVQGEDGEETMPDGTPCDTIEVGETLAPKKSQEVPRQSQAPA